MKLNPDCVRNILLFVEGQPYGAEIRITESLPNELSVYTFQEVKYHAEQCSQSGFLNGYKLNILDEIKIDSLTPAGNKFLNDIRPDSVWEKTKSTASKIGAFSLDFLGKVAASITAEILKRQLP